MVTHREPNYRVVGEMIGEDLVSRPWLIGSGGDPTAMPINPQKSFDSAGAFWKWKGLNRAADRGDAGFDDVMRTVLGMARGHPSYKKRWAIYKAVKSKLPNSLVLGDEMAWERVILAHASFDDGELCGEAYKVLMGSDIKASIANIDNIDLANAFCWPRDVGSNEFLVVGRAARDELPREVRPYIGRPRGISDYRDCVGEDLAQTRRKLAHALDGIEEGLGERFLEETS